MTAPIEYGDRACKTCWGDTVHSYEITGDTVYCLECGSELGTIDWDQDAIVEI